MKRIRETFNDGRLSIVKKTTIRNEFKVKTGTEYTDLISLRFRKMTMRESDVLSIGEVNASKVTTKVKTMFAPIIKGEIKNKYFVKIDSSIFNVIYSDYDKYYCYFYLERVVEDDD